MQKYRIILPVIAIVLLVTWYAFRPERLFVNQRVHEELPTAQAANSPARLLASGKFHSGAHATSGTAAVYQLADGTRLLRFTDFKRQMARMFMSISLVLMTPPITNR